MDYKNIHILYNTRYMRLAFDGVKETDRQRFRILPWEFSLEIFIQTQRRLHQAKVSQSVCLSVFQLFDMWRTKTNEFFIFVIGRFFTMKHDIFSLLKLCEDQAIWHGNDCLFKFRISRNNIILLYIYCITIDLYFNNSNFLKKI